MNIKAIVKNNDELLSDLIFSVEIRNYDIHRYYSPGQILDVSTKKITDMVLKYMVSPNYLEENNIWSQIFF